MGRSVRPLGRPFERLWGFTQQSRTAYRTVSLAPGLPRFYDDSIRRNLPDGPEGRGREPEPWGPQIRLDQNLRRLGENPDGHQPFRLNDVDVERPDRYAARLLELKRHSPFFRLDGAASTLSFPRAGASASPRRKVPANAVPNRAQGPRPRGAWPAARLYFAPSHGSGNSVSHQFGGRTAHVRRRALRARRATPPSSWMNARRRRSLTTAWTSPPRVPA